MLPDHPLKRFKLFRSKDLVESKPSKGPEKLTEKEWINKLKDSKNTKDWIAPCLSSDLSLVEKARVLYVVPLSFYKDGHGMGQLMIELDRSGLSQLSKFIRYNWFLKFYQTDSGLRWCQEVVKDNILGRRIVQREIYIKEQTHALRKSLDLSSHSDTDTSSIPESYEEQHKKLEVYEEELENINREYLVHYRNHWKLQVEAPRGPLRWTFYDTGERSMWASLSWLNDQNAFDDIKDFPFDATSKWTAYTRRVIQAYIFGLDSISLRLEP
ncbi:hypothetical protein DTO212C5_6574 [Paecilomyces variotii]|nr:hypothetical protein DTO212C5_6574 [Paecilomyces variotii]